MTLDEYLQVEGRKKSWFAHATGISPRTITNICSGKLVSPPIAKIVEVFTNGSVRAKDICIINNLHKNS